MLTKIRTTLSVLTVATLAAFGGCADSDNDGAFDFFDNCPGDANFNQVDTDLDGVGDVCDNCPSEANGSQTDADSDGAGAACDENDNNPLIQ